MGVEFKGEWADSERQEPTPTLCMCTGAQGPWSLLVLGGEPQVTHDACGLLVTEYSEDLDMQEPIPVRITHHVEPSWDEMVHYIEVEPWEIPRERFFLLYGAKSVLRSWFVLLRRAPAAIRGAWTR